MTVRSIIDPAHLLEEQPVQPSCGWLVACFPILASARDMRLKNSGF